MKPAAGTGLMNGFFSYTGPSDNQPHDEIDIEFAGQDLRTLRTNYWVNDVPNEQLIPLGFNAGEAFHTYAFEWLPSAIRWYVDGQMVREVIGSDTVPLPSHPSRAMINLWAGDATTNSWLGTFNYTQPVSAQFRNFSYQPFTLSDETGIALTDDSGNALAI